MVEAQKPAGEAPVPHVCLVEGVIALPPVRIAARESSLIIVLLSVLSSALQTDINLVLE
jgi:hypothetical protein